MSTRREKIIEMLSQSDKPLTAQEISQRMGIRHQSIIYDDIEHIAKTLKRVGKELLIRPASCAKCNYVFSGKSSTRKPSRCPKCKSEWILMPAYLVKDKKRV